MYLAFHCFKNKVKHVRKLSENRVVVLYVEITHIRDVVVHRVCMKMWEICP